MEILVSQRELDAMAALWERGPSTAAEVPQALEDDLAYNTALTGRQVPGRERVPPQEDEGRAHRYHSTVEEERAG